MSDSMQEAFSNFLKSSVKKKKEKSLPASLKPFVSLNKDLSNYPDLAWMDNSYGKIIEWLKSKEAAKLPYQLYFLCINHKLISETDDRVCKATGTVFTHKDVIVELFNTIKLKVEGWDPNCDISKHLELKPRGNYLELIVNGTRIIDMFDCYEPL